MKPYKFLLAGSILSIAGISSAFAQQTRLTAPVGSDILPGAQALQGDVKTSIIFSKILPFVIKFAIQLAIALSVIAIIYGGYQYMTAYGDTEKHQVAQKTILWAVLGLALALTAMGIVQIITRFNFT
jgi:hypothetical protein